MLLGVISDTHDQLHPEAIEALLGVDHIIHCGDVCRPQILDDLRAIAPLHAVRGNCDFGGWTYDIPWTETIELGGALIHARHILADLDLDPAAAQISLVLSGHTHRPHQEQQNGVLYLNPGSAGAPRFGLPPSLARVRIEDGRIEVEMRDLAAR